MGRRGLVGKRGSDRMKLKCPKCGSTAQIELVWADRESYSTRHYKEYECGCGCHFEAVFVLKEINELEG